MMSTTSSLLPLLSGAIFGVALTVSSVAQPSIILDQFRLTNAHMLLTFLAASAASALIVTLTNYSGFARLAHRTDGTSGYSVLYDRNIIGGAMQGTAMAITGSCPGTVLVQIALGWGRGRTVALGGLAGGIAYVKLAPLLTRSSAASPEKPRVEQHTVQHKTGLSNTATLLGYEIMMLLIISATLVLASSSSSSSPLLHPLLGGLIIGLAQASSVLLTRKTLGVSSAYQDIGLHFWNLFATPGARAVAGWSSIIFTFGVMLGAKTAVGYLPSAHTGAGSGHGYEVGTPVALMGGFLAIFGARLAGGCTSGHGISGMATMSLSSFVTVAAMFGCGIVVARGLMAVGI